MTNSTRQQQMDWFFDQNIENQMEAARRIGVLAHANALLQMGFSRRLADMFASGSAGCSVRTVQRWRQHSYGIRTGDPLALFYLFPRRNGSKA